MTFDSDRRVALEEVFSENFAKRGEVGAAVSIWLEGEEIVSLHRGWRDRAQTEEWQSDTPVLIWSATKGLASACLLHALDPSGLNSPVATVWPEFGNAGKESITFRQVMSHQAGLSALDELSLSLLDHDAVVEAIEKQRPHWSPGEGHGYAARTYGFMIDEIVRRISGLALGDYWRREFAVPLGLDIWIGMPESEHGRVAQMLAPKVGGCRDESENAFVEALSEPESLTRKAFASPGGLVGASAMNSPAVRAAAIPSLGGIATASSLGKFYAMLACGGEWDGVSYFSSEAIDQMQRRHAEGLDRILLLETAFAVGFMQDPTGRDGNKIRRHFGPSSRAFGHPGAGGCLAFADPDEKIGFAYVMNQMETGVLPGPRALRLVDALYGIG